MFTTKSIKDESISFKKIYYYHTYLYIELLNEEYTREAVENISWNEDITD